MKKLFAIVAVLLVLVPTATAAPNHHLNMCHKLNHGIRPPAYCYAALHLQGGLLIGGPR